jgi:polyhydroxyalkanoate synthesis regulator phasin
MKKAGTPEEVTSPRKADYSTRTAAQRQSLLAELIKKGSITTYEARDQLSIASPAARIIELRETGHDIYTSLETLPDGAGRLHPKSARYVLLKLAEVAE